MMFVHRVLLTTTTQCMYTYMYMLYTYMYMYMDVSTHIHTCCAHDHIVYTQLSTLGVEGNENWCTVLCGFARLQTDALERHLSHTLYWYSCEGENQGRDKGLLVVGVRWGRVLRSMSYSMST